MPNTPDTETKRQKYGEPIPDIDWGFFLSFIFTGDLVDTQMWRPIVIKFLCEQAFEVLEVLNIPKVDLEFLRNTRRLLQNDYPRKKSEPDTQSEPEKVTAQEDPDFKGMWQGLWFCIRHLTPENLERYQQFLQKQMENTKHQARKAVPGKPSI